MPGYIDIHTHDRSSSENRIYNVFAKNDYEHISDKSFSIGLHPWHVKPDHSEVLEIVRQNTKLENCRAVGETGLDRVCNTDFGLQEIVFSKHIEMAEAAGKPLIIHCVRAFDRLLQLKKSMLPTVPWIVHGFNSRAEIADQLNSNGVILSFGKALVLPGSNAQKTLSRIYGNDFFLETDDGNLRIEIIYDNAAKLLQMTHSDILKKIQISFKKIFG
jgi:TatD DNase family protein